MNETSKSFRSSIKQLLAETVSRYPGTDLGADTQKAFLDDWTEQATRVGLPRFSEGVKRARAACVFFPKVAEINNWIPDAAELEESRGGTLADHNCKICSGSGWEPTKTDLGNTAVRRCECWLRNREAGNKPQDNLRKQLREAHEFKRMGEKYYTLNDVFSEVAERINRGELVPADPGMKVWAKKFNPPAGIRKE